MSNDKAEVGSKARLDLGDGEKIVYKLIATNAEEEEYFPIFTDQTRREQPFDYTSPNLIKFQLGGQKPVNSRFRFTVSTTDDQK